MEEFAVGSGTQINQPQVYYKKYHQANSYNKLRCKGHYYDSPTVI